jgi:hypothetical protein
MGLTLQRKPGGAQGAEKLLRQDDFPLFFFDSLL